MPRKIIVHLCDVDDGLMIRWNHERSNELNHNLISAMKTKQAEANPDEEINLYYLFTNMDASHIGLAHDCTRDNRDKGQYVTRPRLIEAMGASGLPIQAVITWADRKYGQGLGKAYEDKLAPMEELLKQSDFEGFSRAQAEFNQYVDFSDFSVPGMVEREAEKGSTFNYTVANIRAHIESQGIELKEDDEISFIHYDDTHQMRSGVVKANRALPTPYPVTTVATYQGKVRESKEYYLAAIEAHKTGCPEFFSHATYDAHHADMPEFQSLKPQAYEDGPAEYTTPGRLYDFGAEGLCFFTPTHELSQAYAILSSDEVSEQGIHQACTLNGPHHALFVANFSSIVSREMLKNDTMKAKVDSIIASMEPEAQQFLSADNYKNYHKLVEVIALLHDSGRPSDGIDEWDPSNCINVEVNVRNILQTSGLTPLAIDSIMVEVKAGIENKDNNDLTEDDGLLFGAPVGAGDALHSGHAFHGGMWDHRSFDANYVRVYKQYPEFQSQFSAIVDEVSRFVRLPTEANGGRLAAVKDYLAWHQNDGDGRAILKHDFAQVIQGEFNSLSSSTHPIMAEHMLAKHQERDEHDQRVAQEPCRNAIVKLQQIYANSNTSKTLSSTANKHYEVWKALQNLSERDVQQINDPVAELRNWQDAMNSLLSSYKDSHVRKIGVTRLLKKLREENPAYRLASAYLARCDLSAMASNNDMSCTQAEATVSEAPAMTETVSLAVSLAQSMPIFLSSPGRVDEVEDIKEQQIGFDRMTFE